MHVHGVIVAGAVDFPSMLSKLGCEKKQSDRIKEKFVGITLMYYQLFPTEKTGQTLAIYIYERLPPSCQQHENEWRKRASSAHSVCDKL